MTMLSRDPARRLALLSMQLSLEILRRAEGREKEAHLLNYGCRSGMPCIHHTGEERALLMKLPAREASRTICIWPLTSLAFQTRARPLAFIYLQCVDIAATQFVQLPPKLAKSGSTKPCHPRAIPTGSGDLYLQPRVLAPNLPHVRGVRSLSHPRRSPVGNDHGV